VFVPSAGEDDLAVMLGGGCQAGHAGVVERPEAREVERDGRRWDGSQGFAESVGGGPVEIAAEHERAGSAIDPDVEPRFCHGGTALAFSEGRHQPEVCCGPLVGSTHVGDPNRSAEAHRRYGVVHLAHLVLGSQRPTGERRSRRCARTELTTSGSNVANLLRFLPGATFGFPPSG